ncbi:MAG: SHOCT domain-containing protein [Thermodesulfobacteriota bacterium]
MMGNGVMGEGMWVWMFFNIIIWIVVILGIVLLVVWVDQKTRLGEGSRVEESALAILKKRYARAEISKEEYKEEKQDIS